MAQLKKPGNVYNSKADRETRKLAKQLSRRCNLPLMDVLRTLDNLNATSRWLHGESIEAISHDYNWTRYMTLEIVEAWFPRVLAASVREAAVAPLYGRTK
jgi:hypothetical protein